MPLIDTLQNTMLIVTIIIIVALFLKELKIFVVAGLIRKQSKLLGVLEKLKLLDR